MQKFLMSAFASFATVSTLAVAGQYCQDCQNTAVQQHYVQVSQPAVVQPVMQAQTTMKAVTKEVPVTVNKVRYEEQEKTVKVQVAVPYTETVMQTVTECVPETTYTAVCPQPQCCPAPQVQTMCAPMVQSACAPQVYSAPTCAPQVAYAAPMCAPVGYAAPMCAPVGYAAPDCHDDHSRKKLVRSLFCNISGRRADRQYRRYKRTDRGADTYCSTY